MRYQRNKIQKGERKVARGKKYDLASKEKALAFMAASNNLEETSRQLNIPVTTLHTWKKEAETKSQEFVELRNKRKQEFIEDAWNLITKSKQLLLKKLTRALESEDALNELLYEFETLNNKDISQEQRRAMYKKFANLKLEDIGKITTVLGTLYDKQALASEEATSIIKGTITLEDYVKKVEGDEF